MAQRVQIDDEILEFPDDMTDDEIRVVIDKQYAPTKPKAATKKAATPTQQLAFDRYKQSADYDEAAEEGTPANPILKAPGQTIPVGKAYISEDGEVVSSNKGTADQGLGFMEGLKRPLDNAALWLDKIAPGVSEFGEKLGMASPEQAAAATQSDVEAAAAQGRRPGVMGQIAGSTISAAPVLMATRNPWLVGAGSGALATKNPESARSVAVDAGLGAAGGKIGDTAMRAVGGIVAPRLNPLVEKLLGEGVELTPGQILGGVTHRAEDAIRSIYGVGDMVIGAQNRGRASLNRAAVQRTLEPLGIKIPKNIPEGHAQVKFAQETLSNSYDKVLAGVAPKLDQTFGANVAQLRRMSQSLPKDQRHVFESFIQGELREAFNPQNGAITGRQLKQVDEILGQKIRNFSSSSNPHDRDMARGFMELQAELRDLIGRQYPQHAKTIDALNQGWASLIRVETAAAPAKGGVFTEEALRTATRQADKSMRHRTSARGEAKMQDLADAASQVMSPTMGDSGTPARALATGLVGTALFGLPSKGLSVNPWAASALAAMAAPYANRFTGKVARAAIASRPKSAPAARRAIVSASPVAAIAAGQEPARRKPAPNRASLPRKAK